MTHLCVAIFVNDISKAKRDIATAIEAGADIVELRIDSYTDPLALPGLRELSLASATPFIITCRPTWEGGHCELSDDERLTVLDAFSAGSTRYIDLELATVRSANQLPAWRQLIVSHHDFASRPTRLNNIVLEMNQLQVGTINKLVWTARTIRDNLEAFELLKTRQKPTIALCMGEAGLISRILAKKFGSFLTFASLDPCGGTASGQIPIADMKNLYRWDAINEKTRVYGVVGSPIMHSMSPAIHNAAFTAVGHDGIYLPMLVEPTYESFKAFMESFLHFNGLDLSGLSITIPHKENALRYLQEKDANIDPLARSIGTINTIIVDRSPQASVPSPQSFSLRGLNTDYAAFLDSITTKLNISRDDLANYRIAVIGAGGAGRTAVAALAHYGATVVIYNRTQERADALAREFNGRQGRVVSARMEKLCDSCCHIFINTTSVGMFPKVDESPVGDRAPHFTRETLVFDTIYNPVKTKLLAQARKAGAKTISGVEMFVRQAVGQFEAWTGQPAPADIMRRVIERQLAG